MTYLAAYLWAMGAFALGAAVLGDGRKEKSWYAGICVLAWPVMFPLCIVMAAIVDALARGSRRSAR